MAEMYHIALNGLPAKCTAGKKPCPRTEHFDNKLEAFQAAEELLNEEYGLTKTVTSKGNTYHVSGTGSIEICESPDKCKVKAFGKYSNVHSKDVDTVIGAGKAFQVALGSHVADEGNVTVIPKPKKTPTVWHDPTDFAKPIYLDNDEDLNTYPNISTIANDPITRAAREVKGIEPKRVFGGNTKPEVGDIIFPEMDSGNYRTVKPGDDPNEIIQDLLEKGYHPDDLRVRAAASCGHFVSKPFIDVDRIDIDFDKFEQRLKSSVPSYPTARC